MTKMNHEPAIGVHHGQPPTTVQSSHVHSKAPGLDRATLDRLEHFTIGSGISVPSMGSPVLGPVRHTQGYQLATMDKRESLSARSRLEALARKAEDIPRTMRDENQYAGRLTAGQHD